MSKSVGQSKLRVDAFDKAAGRAQYTDDLCGRAALVTRIVHSTIAHGMVRSVDTAAAEQVPGVVRVFTCFDVPDIPFPTAGHPWSTDPHHQDVADRLLLNRHVRYYGDDVAVAKRTMLAMLESDKRVLHTPDAPADPFVALSELADSAIVVVARTWTLNGDYWDLFFDMNERFYNELPQQGLHFPFPQLDVHLDK